MGQRLIYWILLGVIGFAAFLLLRPQVDFSAEAPIEASRTTIEGKTGELANRLGFSVDSLHMLSMRTQHLKYYKVLKDSLKADTISIGQLNRSGANLSGWKVVIGKAVQDNDLSLMYDGDVFSATGRLELLYDQNDNVRRINSHPDNPNPTFVAGDSLSAIADQVVSRILNYNLANYTLGQVNVQDTLLMDTEPGFKPKELALSKAEKEDHPVFQFNWTKNNAEVPGPAHLLLELKPMIKEAETPGGTSIKYGASIEKFRAFDAGETVSSDKNEGFSNAAFIFSFSTIAVLAILVFFLGIKYINRGQVEWKRAAFIMFTVMLGVFGWRILYLINTLEPFFNQTANTVFLLNQLLFSGVCGLYAALAYVGWEAQARSRDGTQLHLVDAYWHKRFFFKQTGDTLIRGYALGGVLLGIFALALYVLNTVFYQTDSQFGFSEPSLQPQLLSLNVSAGINVLLVALGHVGVSLGILQNKLKRQWQFYIAGIIITAFLFAGSAALISIQGPIWYDIFAFGLMAPAIVYVFNKAGLLTFCSGWGLFVVVLLILPYWGSPSLDVAYIAWVESFVILLPLIYGIIAYRYGASIADLGPYIPEYQERMSNHLRVEKEIEIARESQFKLMPLKPPVIEGVDVYGFFMPSFEVGGDYFDYVLSQNGRPGEGALTMTIADVSGKAMKAAMHAVFTSGLLLSRLHKDNPEAILREVAPTLYARTDPQTFITCIIARYHFATRALTIANAGHCLPILKRAAKATFISTPHPKYPLGLRADVLYEPLSIQLQRGDFLLLYSDGLPEAVNSGGERLGYENLLKIVESLETDTKTSNEIALEIKRKVQKFSEYQLADDTTIICLKV